MIEIGRVRLNVYVENRDPFNKWLSEAEIQLSNWSRVDCLGKEKLVELSESLRAFKMDVEMHSHEMGSCETMANKFMDTAKVQLAVVNQHKNFILVVVISRNISLIY